MKAKAAESLHSLLLEFSDFLLFLELGHFFPLQALLDLLAEPFDAPTEQIKVIVALFVELSSILHSGLFIKVINDDDLVFFVFVLVELWKILILLNTGPRETEGLSNMILFVFFWLPEIDKQEICLDADWKLFCFDGD